MDIREHFESLGPIVTKQRRGDLIAGFARGRITTYSAGGNGSLPPHNYGDEYRLVHRTPPFPDVVGVSLAEQDGTPAAAKIASNRDGWWRFSSCTWHNRDEIVELFDANDWVIAHVPTTIVPTGL